MRGIGVGGNRSPSCSVWHIRAPTAHPKEPTTCSRRSYFCSPSSLSLQPPAVTTTIRERRRRLQPHHPPPAQSRRPHQSQWTLPRCRWWRRGWVTSSPTVRATPCTCSSPTTPGHRCVTYPVPLCGHHSKVSHSRRRRRRRPARHRRQRRRHHPGHLQRMAPLPLQRRRRSRRHQRTRPEQHLVGHLTHRRHGGIRHGRRHGRCHG